MSRGGTPNGANPSDDPSPPPGPPVTVPRFAAVDIGTNTVRLLVAEIPGGGAQVQWLERRSTVVRLGEGVDRTGRLDEKAIDRTVAALAEFHSILGGWPDIEVRAIATSATRDATNREQFLDRAATALGFRPEMITGDEEASLSFAGAAAGVGSPGPFLVIDPGGGSTEFVFGEDRPETSISVDIGSVRLTERLLPHHPATADEIEVARRHVDELFARHVALPTAPGTVLGVAGTFTSLAAIHLDLAVYDPDTVHGTVLGGDDLAGLTDRLGAMSIAEVAAIPSVEAGRAPVLLGGAVVAERAAIHVRATAVTVSERDILDGIVADLARRSGT